MTLAETYACRFTEGGMTHDNLVTLFDAALKEGANRERARCVRAMQAEIRRNGNEISDLASWEMVGWMVEAIQPKPCG